MNCFKLNFYEIKRIDNPKLQKVYLDKVETLTRSDIEEMRIRFSPRDSENIIKTGEIISVTPIETPNNELNKYKIKVNKKIEESSRQPSLNIISRTNQYHS
jgi:hypothetical protein